MTGAAIVSTTGGSERTVGHVFLSWSPMIFKGRWVRPWDAAPAPPDPESFAPKSILLASEGKAIPVEAVELVARLTAKANAPVHVFSIARIWGSSFGLPHPGLMPTKREWSAQHEIVAQTIQELKRRGIEASGGVVSSRNAAGRILAEIKRRQPDAVVMAAPPPHHWLYAGLFWDQDAYRVRQQAEAPVYIVVDK